MMSLKLAVCIAFLPLASARPSWAPSDWESGRRLALTVGLSHNQSDADCIAVAYDPNFPQKSYVGGPCSQLDTSGSDPVPLGGFRWLEMETVYVTMETSDGQELDFQRIARYMMHTMDHARYMEIGLARYFQIAGALAEVSVSTTSYMTKMDFTYTKNEFVVDNANGTFQTMEVCVKECCSTPGANGCTCAGGQCPTESITAAAGKFKYSILAATGDSGSSNYVAGPNGNGWERVVADYGTGSPKQVQGNIVVYQVFDFTNMRADKVTVLQQDGTTVTWANMATCDFMDNATSSVTCPTTAQYTVNSISFEADSGWEGGFSFPQTYNYGSWAASSNSERLATVEGTRAVTIHLLKPTGANIEALGFNAAAKAVLLRYTLDFSGATATSSSGTFVVYDPSVQSQAPGSGPPAASGSSGSGGGSGSTATSGPPGSSGSGGGSSSTTIATAAGSFVNAASRPSMVFAFILAATALAPLAGLASSAIPDGAGRPK